jgi:hypothetical protein
MKAPSFEGPGLRLRLGQWAATRNYVAVGNLGERVAMLLLQSIGYQLLGAQDDFLGMVADVLDEETADNPEDLIAIDPHGRLVTVNTKATMSHRSCRLKRDGNLTRPQIGSAQRQVAYSTRRASLITPLSGDSFAQIAKVDLLNCLAQIFEVSDTGLLEVVSEVFEVSGYVAEVLLRHPNDMPPPRVWELDDEGGIP